jgi:hypothetical protein
MLYAIRRQANDLQMVLNPVRGPATGVLNTTIDRHDPIRAVLSVLYGA